MSSVNPWVLLATGLVCGCLCAAVLCALDYYLEGKRRR